MRDKILFFLYIFFIVLLTSIHNIYFISGITLFFFVLAYSDFLEILKKSIFSILLFNSIISISYIIYSLIKGIQWIDYIVLVNLRVFSLTFLTFLFIKKVNLFKALSFSKTLSYLLVLSYSQILMFKKYFIDFKMSLKSRTLIKPNKKDLYNFVSTVFYFFLNKSINNSKEISQAMKSRGFFND
jgi:cobalt/nickel transport system permease protein